MPGSNNVSTITTGTDLIRFLINPANTPAQAKKILQEGNVVLNPCLSLKCFERYFDLACTAKRSWSEVRYTLHTRRNKHLENPSPKGRIAFEMINDIALICLSNQRFQDDVEHTQIINFFHKSCFDYEAPIPQLAAMSAKDRLALLYTCAANTTSEQDRQLELNVRIIAEVIPSDYPFTFKPGQLDPLARGLIRFDAGFLNKHFPAHIDQIRKGIQSYVAQVSSLAQDKLNLDFFLEFAHIYCLGLELECLEQKGGFSRFLPNISVMMVKSILNSPRTTNWEAYSKTCFRIQARKDIIAPMQTLIDSFTVLQLTSQGRLCGSLLFVHDLMRYYEFYIKGLSELEIEHFRAHLGILIQAEGQSFVTALGSGFVEEMLKLSLEERSWEMLQRFFCALPKNASSQNARKDARNQKLCFELLPQYLERIEKGTVVYEAVKVQLAYYLVHAPASEFRTKLVQHFEMPSNYSFTVKLDT